MRVSVVPVKPPSTYRPPPEALPPPPPWPVPPRAWLPTNWLSDTVTVPVTISASHDRRASEVVERAAQAAAPVIVVWGPAPHPGVTAGRLVVLEEGVSDGQDVALAVDAAAFAGPAGRAVR